MASLDSGGNTSITLAADLVPVLIKEKLLSIADKGLVFYEIGDKEDLPEGNGKTVQFTRYERLSLPNAPLTEGTDPTTTPLTTSIVQAVVDQWGAVVSVSDVAEMTVRHPVMKVAQSRLGTQHSELVDREIQKVLMGTSNVNYANARTSRSTLVAGDVIGTDDIRKLVSTLRNNGAPTMDGGMMTGVLDPFIEMDLSKDSTFVNASSYSNIRTLLNGEVGSWMGVRWKRSNFVPIIAVGTYASPGVVTPTNNTTLNNFVGFTAAATNRAKVTRLDATTGFETTIFADTAVTNAAAYAVIFTLSNTVTPSGVYNFYVSMDGAPAGTTTFQQRVTYVAGTTFTLKVYKGLGTGTVVNTGLAQELVVSITGAIAPPDTSTAGNVHTTYVFGKESFGVVDLSGMKTYMTPPTASDSDPLVQRRKIGWKQMFKAVIKNTDFFRRLESLSAFN